MTISIDDKLFDRVFEPRGYVRHRIDLGKVERRDVDWDRAIGDVDQQVEMAVSLILRRDPPVAAPPRSTRRRAYLSSGRWQGIVKRSVTRLA